MTKPRESSWTVIRVRGKRSGLGTEKRSRHTRRKPELRMPRSALTSSQTKIRPQRRRRRHERLSLLEQLPVEILQLIFAYSTNICLPSASRELALKLTNNQHLRLRLTSLILDPVLGCQQDGGMAASALSNATRLLNSRYMTWEFFKIWLRVRTGDTSTVDDSSADEDATIALWDSLGPTWNLLPPRKLLAPPFTAENVKFLRLLTRRIPNISAINVQYGELASEGLTAAVDEASVPAVSVFFGMGLPGSTELLRRAVINAGCDKDIVRMTVERSPSQKDGAIDLLDPVIWSWAERNKSDPNSNAEWLLAFLQNALKAQTRP